jgi:hypothetical protein
MYVTSMMQDEALRLWRDLALVEKDKEFLTRMKFAQTLRVVEEWLERTQASYAAEVGGSSVAQSRCAHALLHQLSSLSYLMLPCQ